MAKKAAPAADTSLRQWLLTDRSTRRLRKQLKRAERQGATKKELQEMASSTPPMPSCARHTPPRLP